jgi:hypothetical protein
LDPKWRNQTKVTVKLPTSNRIANTEKLTQAVVEAHRKMRLLHPAALRDVIDARRERLRSIDPRFDLKLALDPSGKPVMQLYPLQEVSLTMHVLGGKQSLSKLTDLFDKGAVVEFEPGEIRVSGSRVFEQVEFLGGTLSAGQSSPGTVTLIARNTDGSEQARLGEIPGNFTGGKKELWFNGELKNSPLTIRLGPIAKEVGGLTNVTLSLTKWDGQKLRHLAYFDRLFSFFTNAASYGHLDVLLEINGNSAGFIPTKSLDVDRFLPVCDMLVFIQKARKVAEYFGLDPLWRATPITTQQEEDIEELYDILFDGGRSEATPDSVITFTADDSQLKMSETPTMIQFIGKWTYDILSHGVEVKLTRQTTHVLVAKSPVLEGTGSTPRVEVTATATPQSVTTVRLAVGNELV